MLTLEERERIAYITNSPDHALIVRAIEGDEDVADELRHERDTAQEEAHDASNKADELERDLETAETKLERLEEENDQLKQQIHEAGVDLV